MPHSPFAIFHGGDPTVAILNLEKIARCQGLPTQLNNLACSLSPAMELQSWLSSNPGLVALDIQSLGNLISATDWKSLSSFMAINGGNVLLLATGSDDCQAEVINLFSEGRVTGIRAAGKPQTVSFRAEARHLNAELAGHQYGRSNREALALECIDAPEIVPVMAYAPCSVALLSLKYGAVRLFIWSTLVVFDVERPLDREIDFEEAVDEYIPAIICLRAGFGDRCWHSPWIGADIIIDDPLLKNRYGFIDFPELLHLTKALDFHVTLAFIPWNHWRTRKSSLQPFLDHQASFGICAHGCDHIGNEFRNNDYLDLLGRCYLAAERMDIHRKRTGMAWDNLMVCPREDYTLTALQALSDSGRYLGISNTGCIPRDMTSKVVRGSDLLLPAQDAFFGFPIFKRYYWSNLSVFAMAAFLGKPTILVEHHDFLRAPERGLKEFVTQLKAECPRARWANLVDIARRTCLHKRTGTTSFAIRLFADGAIVSNPDPEPRIFQFRRRLPQDTVIQTVTVGDSQVSFGREDGMVCFEAQVPGNGVAKVELFRSPVPNNTARPRDWIYHGGVAIRRFSSEFRDNWLSHSRPLLNMANRLMQKVRLRGPK